MEADIRIPVMENEGERRDGEKVLFIDIKGSIVQNWETMCIPRMKRPQSAGKKPKYLQINV